MEKFQHKYRIASARASWWDYGWNGAYFITICTKNREHFFGKIENGQMQLSGIGILADVFWHEIKNHAKNVELGAFVVMPNHIHGILILDKPENEPFANGNDVHNVETRHALSLQPPIQPQSPAQQRFQNQGQNTVSSIIGSYKSAVTTVSYTHLDVYKRQCLASALIFQQIEFMRRMKTGSIALRTIL